MRHDYVDTIKERVAVVTGGSTGIGYETVRRLCKRFAGRVYLTSSSAARGMQAVARLRRRNCFPDFFRLDIGNQTSRMEFRDHLQATYGGVDVLVNNAAVFSPPGSATLGVYNSYQQTASILQVNFFGTMVLCQLLFPLLRSHARIVNLSDACGHLSYIPGQVVRNRFLHPNLDFKSLISLVDGFKAAAERQDVASAGWPDDPYCVSKTAVNALTLIQQRFAAFLPNVTDVVVNAYNPGRVMTLARDYQGDRSPRKAAKNVVALAMLPDYVIDPVGKLVWHDFSIVDWNSARPVY